MGFGFAPRKQNISLSCHKTVACREVEKNGLLYSVDQGKAIQPVFIELLIVYMQPHSQKNFKLISEIYKV